ncbi:MAG: phosphate ABC transporter substrate-binding protein [Thermoanaerobaculia bacterium]
MTFTRLSSAIALWAVVVLAAACGGGERPATETGAEQSGRPLTIKGSDTMVILGQRLAEEYMQQNPGTIVQVNGGGSGTGIAALINGTVDLAQASRAMKPEERESVAKNRNAAVVETPVALDALAVFVHRSNPVENVTIEQLKQIFQGTITNWTQVGGPDVPIILYGRENSSGTYDYFREHVLGGEDFAPRVQTLQGTAAVINAVAKDSAGIGYGGIAYASDVKALGIAAGGNPPVTPSDESVANGTYPLARHLYYYYLENAPERVTNFVRYSLTPEAQQLVEKVGYFPLSTTRQAAETNAP